MDAASKTALGAVHSEETAHFGQNAIEGARLVAIASLDDIAMHRVAGPDDRMAFALNGADAPGQARFDLIMSIARDERHASRLPTGIEQVKHAQQPLGLQAGTTFHAYGLAKIGSESCRERVCSVLVDLGVRRINKKKK